MMFRQTCGTIKEGLNHAAREQDDEDRDRGTLALLSGERKESCAGQGCRELQTSRD